MNRELDSFEVALLHELRTVVAGRADTAKRGPFGAFHRGSGRMIFLAAAAVAATVLLTLTPGALSSPAYAVEQGSSGDVIVRIDRLEDAQQLQRALLGFGVTADVRYLGDGMQCTPNRFQPAASAPRSRTRFTVGSNGISVVLDRRDISQGQTVVISASHVGNGVNGEVGIATGPLSPCLPVPFQTHGSLR